jgi:hypothetical protein
MEKENKKSQPEQPVMMIELKDLMPRDQITGGKGKTVFGILRRQQNPPGPTNKKSL